MKYCLVSVPLEAVDSDEPLDALKGIIGDNGTVLNFAVPDFKIGTLDALVQQADDLGKLDTNCEGLVAKVADSLKSLLDDSDKVEEQKLVNDSMHPTRSLPLPEMARSQTPQSLPTTTYAHSTGTRSGIEQTSPLPS